MTGIDLSSLPSLKQVVVDYDLAAKHRMGQHFLLDQNITDKIAKAALPLDQVSIIEIGPGPGGLTRSLLAAGARKLYCIEKDWRFLPPLKEIEKLSQGRLTIIEGDALSIKLQDIAPPPYRIIANLPYNIATPLITQWLGDNPLIECMVLMVQAEVGARLAAKPDQDAYGRLGALASWRAEVESLFILPPSVFTPPPKVQSAVIRITPKPLDQMGDVKIGDFETITRAAFGQRRKMLRRSLTTLDIPAESLLLNAGIEGDRRAETLNTEEFLRLCKSYRQLKS